MRTEGASVDEGVGGLDEREERQRRNAEGEEEGDESGGVWRGAGQVRGRCEAEGIERACRSRTPVACR